MSKQTIPATLAALFCNHPIVFWHDAEAAFGATVDALQLDGVQVVRLDDTAALRVKIDIERNNGARWLLYSNKPEPEPERDWLLDVRLRAKSFHADAASILLDELGLGNPALRPHLKQRTKFFATKDRTERLKRWIAPQDSAQDLDRKMLAVLTRADAADPASILLKLFAALAAEAAGDLDAQPKLLAEIGAHELAPAFWAMAQAEFGYSDVAPNLRGLLFALFATEFAQSIGEEPVQLKQFLIAKQAEKANAAAFVSRWRSDMGNTGSYDNLARLVAEALRIDDMLGTVKLERMVQAMTFEDIEKRIVSDLKERVIAGRGANMDSVRALINRRRDGRWANLLLAGASDATQCYAASYDGLAAAADFFELHAKHGDGFSFANAHAAFTAYADELHRFDQLYRWFMKAADTVAANGWGVLQDLRVKMEEVYLGWYITQLASAWGSVIEGPTGLLADWRMDKVVNQQDFFAQHVEPAFSGGAKRVFVVISDAFRFEAAEELSRELNARSRVKASIGTMLGVLPSCTALGMASLLPHQALAYREGGSLDVLVDGKSSAGLEQRAAILAPYGGVAVQAGALLKMGKEKGRECVKPHRLVYIYHDVIDMIGDKRGSETQTFDAAAKAIKELSDLVRYIINSLNGTTVLVTADHGFLYQESALAEADRTTLEARQSGALLSKKRYILGRNLEPSGKEWHGNTANSAGTDPGQGSLDFLLPKGAGRFHFSGGARFVHGSAMPQEIVIPVITVKESETETAKTKTVQVALLGSSNKVVTNKQRFEFIQTEAVSGRTLAATLLVSIRDGGKRVSDEQAVTFDSTSNQMEDRKRSVMLTIGAGEHDRTKDFFLVACDAKTKVEVLRMAVKIDLAFSNDF